MAHKPFENNFLIKLDCFGMFLSFVPLKLDSYSPKPTIVAVEVLLLGAMATLEKVEKFKVRSHDNGVSIFQ